MIKEHIPVGNIMAVRAVDKGVVLNASETNKGVLLDGFLVCVVGRTPDGRETCDRCFFLPTDDNCPGCHNYNQYRQTPGVVLHCTAL